MVLAYVDYEYFVQTFCWVFQPPIRIAIDTVTIVSLGIIFNVLSFAHIIATSRTYIVSTKGITVTFLGVFHRLYPWQRFQIVGVFPVDKMGSTEVGQPFFDGLQYQTDSDDSWWGFSVGIRYLPLASHFDFSTTAGRGTHAI